MLWRRVEIWKRICWGQQFLLPLRSGLKFDHMIRLEDDQFPSFQQNSVKSLTVCFMSCLAWVCSNYFTGLSSVLYRWVHTTSHRVNRAEALQGSIDWDDFFFCSFRWFLFSALFTVWDWGPLGGTACVHHVIIDCTKRLLRGWREEQKLKWRENVLMWKRRKYDSVFFFFFVLGWESR